MENPDTSKLKLLAGKRLKAGALQLSIYIAVIIALILVGLMLYAGTFIYLKEQSSAAIENIRTTEYVMSGLLKTAHPSNDTVNLVLKDAENQSVHTHVSQWGIFQKVYIRTEHRKKRFTKMAIIGSEVKAENAPNLYLADNYSPLSIVGTTFLSGNVFVPAAGIKPGYINGESYYGEKLVDGYVKQSNAGLPALDKEIVSGIKSYLTDNSGYDSTDRVVFSGKTSNSFLKPTQKYYSKHSIVFEDASIVGNLIFKSDTLIRVKSTAALKDIILIAPIIEIEDEVTGNFQAIASNKIRVGKNCNLYYPTALGIHKTESAVSRVDIGSNQVFIDQGTKIAGTIFYLQETFPDNDYITNILITEGVKIKGQVYCKGNLEASGNVSGSVFAQKLIVNRYGTKFVNHLYNVSIENKNIADLYGGIIFTNQNKTVMKWLY